MAEEKQKTKQETEEKKEEKKIVETLKKDTKTKAGNNQLAKADEKIGDKGVSDKKEEVKEEKKIAKDKPRKDKAVVNSLNLPISAKESVAVCKFIKGKGIDRAISDLEMVMVQKKPVPMKGEIPHRRGKGIMSGRFPKKSAKFFIKTLKSLSGNAIANGIDNPMIVEAVANIGQRQYGRFGSVRRKRTHLKIIVVQRKTLKQEIKK